MLPNTRNHFLDYFPLQNQTPKSHFPYRNSLSHAFILHLEFDLHWTKCSLRPSKDDIMLHFDTPIWKAILQIVLSGI